MRPARWMGKSCVGKGPQPVSHKLPAWTSNSNRSEIELPNMQHCVRRSELELRGPTNSLKMNPRAS
eukprot:8552255-Alexandrium_andersonii.AAC.1